MSSSGKERMVDNSAPRKHFLLVFLKKRINWSFVLISLVEKREEFKLTPPTARQAWLAVFPRGDDALWPCRGHRKIPVAAFAGSSRLSETVRRLQAVSAAISTAILIVAVGSEFQLELGEPNSCKVQGAWRQSLLRRRLQDRNPPN